MNPLAAIGTVIGIVDKIIPDPAQKAEALRALAELETQGALKQLDVNIAEAASGNLFVSGWRPAIGWISAACFAYALIGREILMVLGQSLFGIDPTAFPNYDSGLLTTVLLGILGLGAMRSYEKTR